MEPFGWTLLRLSLITLSASLPPHRILRVGRLFLQIFSQLFFMNVMNFFLLPSACDWWGRMTVRRRPRGDWET